jgi:type IV secretion system protein VirD4
MGALKTVKRSLLVASLMASRVDSFFSHKKYLHNARFAALHELENLLSHSLDETETSLLLGANYLNQVVRVRPTKTRRELGNMLVVAPTRGGKGLLAVSQLLTWPHSVIVNDIKGDLFAQTAGYRSTLGKVFCLDPTGVGHRYDPLEGRVTEDQLYASAHHLLFQAHETDKIFTERAKSMLTLMLLGARKKAIAPFPCARFLTRSGVGDTAHWLHAISPSFATQFLNIQLPEANFDDKFLLSCWGTLTARLRGLLTDTVIRSISGSDFRAASLMTSPTPITVYLRWPERELEALSPLVRLLWASLIDELISTYDQAQGKNCHPVLLLVDEAGRTAIPLLAEMATTVVGRGVSLWIAVQSLSQLKAVYGAARADTLLNNMDSQIYYRQASQETAEYVERKLGYRSGYAYSETLHHGDKSSEGRAERPIPLLSSQDITQLSDRDIIAFHHNLHPIRLRRIDWRDHPSLVKRRSLTPPKIDNLPPVTDEQMRQLHLRAPDLSYHSQDEPDEELINPDEIG